MSKKHSSLDFFPQDHYTWIFTSRIFRLALERTFLINKCTFSCKWLTSCSHKDENLISGRGEGWKKTEERRLLGTPEYGQIISVT